MNPAAAIEAWVRPGDRILLGTGAGEPVTLEQALVDDRERLTPLILLAGLQFGGYPYSVGLEEGRWKLETWHTTSRIRRYVEGGAARLHTVRNSHVLRLIDRLQPSVFLTSVSPPNVDGLVSFGASVSYAKPMAEQILATGRRVIAEINPNMPFVLGDTALPASAFTALVETDSPLPSYRSGEPDAASGAIARRVVDLLPEAPTIQIGIGAVPEGIVELLAADPPSGVRLFGMGIDGMIPLLEKVGSPGTYIGGELLGTERLYRYAHNEPRLLNYPMAKVVDLNAIGRIPGFVSVIGGLQVDLSGQINSEVIGGKVVSAPGGGFDFVDGSWLSERGISVVALRSTAVRGTVSSIVSELERGAPVTIPRHSVRYVVTEHGVADLFGLSTAERAEALIALADPEFRDELGDAWQRQASKDATREK